MQSIRLNSPPLPDKNIPKRLRGVTSTGADRRSRAWVWKVVPIPKTTNKKRLGDGMFRTVSLFSVPF